MRKYGLLFLSLVLGACSSLNYKQLRKENSLWEFAWTSGACMRSCPVYNAQINQSGELFFEAIRHCKVEGDTLIDLGYAISHELLDSLESIQYLELDTAYGLNPGIMDIPVNTYKLSKGDQSKLIRYQADMPKGLMFLDRWLQKQLKDQGLI